MSNEHSKVEQVSCGCESYNQDDCDYEIDNHIHYCPLHAAAGEMLVFLKEYRHYLRTDSITWDVTIPKLDALIDSAEETKTDNAERG